MTVSNQQGASDLDRSAPFNPQEDLAESGSFKRTNTGRVGIGGKLIAAMIFVSLVSVLAMGIATRIGFDRGFVDYLNERGIAKLQSLEPRLAAEYRNSGGWDFLLTSPLTWFEIVGIPGGLDEVPPIGSPVGDEPPVDASGVSLRIALLNESREFIIGYTGYLDEISSSVEEKIEVDGATVGWLVYQPATDVITAADRRFKNKQTITTLLVGMTALCIAVALAAVLGKRFIQVLLPIRTAIRELARGNYRVQLPATNDDEIGDLSADVNHLAMVLERNESVRRNLMADLSHELRTPIAILQVEMEALEDGMRPLSKESLRSLHTEVKTLSVLVKDIYEVSSSDAGALSYRIHPLDITDLLECTLGAFEGRRTQRNIQVQVTRFSGPVWVEADEGRLSQLFNNLIENSMRYTYARGRLEIDCQLDEQMARVIMEDSAPGVSDDLLPYLFERSFQFRRRVDNGGKGNGLGLAICKNIVEAHRGKISASSSGLGGLRIQIELPRLNR